MDKTNKYWRIIPTTVFGILIIFKLILRAESETLFDGMITGGLILIFFLSMIWTNIKDIKEHKRKREKSSFIPTIVGVSVLCAVIVTNHFINQNSPVIIQASYDGGFNGCGFEFKEDGTYKYFNGSGLGVENNYGSYSIQDSIIKLDRTQIDKVIKSNLLAIRSLPWADPIHIIYQINDKHEIVDKNFVFIINKDNRK